MHFQNTSVLGDSRSNKSTSKSNLLTCDSRRRLRSYSSVMPVAIWLVLAGLALNAKAEDHLFWPKGINNNLIVIEYVEVGKKSIPLNHLEFDGPPNASLEKLPVTRSETDWEALLLTRGLAKLRDPSTAPKNLKDAELWAKNRKIGIWAVAQATSPKSPPPTTPPNPVAKPPGRPLGETIVYWVRELGGYLAVLTALIAVVGWLARTLRRTKVTILFLGPQSAGKTWLWARFKDPEISRTELSKYLQSSSLERSRAHVPEIMGRFEVTPAYVSVPGGQPGLHLEQLLHRRWFSRTKSICVLTLSTTPSELARFEGSKDSKIDKDYISEQLGYTALPLAVITARKVPKPAMVLVVITKFDLFSGREPNHRDSAGACAELQQLFSQHITRVQNACKKHSIPNKVVFCSATEGWGMQDFQRHIKNGLFKS